MHKITKIEVIATDGATRATVKLIHSTAGDAFYSRRCAYNQTFERLEQTIGSNGAKRLEMAPPLSIHTLRYLVKPHPRSKLPTIRQLTASRLRNNPEQDSLFNHEVQRIVQRSYMSKNVVLYYFQITADDWSKYSMQDLETLVALLLEAGVPHITVLSHPHKSDEENIAFIEEQIVKLSPEQTVFGQFSPSMRKRHGRIVLQRFFTQEKVIGLLMTGLTPSNASNTFHYSFCLEHAPKGVLMCAADVRDTFGPRNQRLASALAFRRFGFDIVCRKVASPLTGFNFPVPVQDVRIYDDNTSGMLTEEDQRLWHGKSVTEFILEHFPAGLGLDFREYALAFNFIELNKTGLKECQLIVDKKHPAYIEARVYLQTFHAATQQE